MTLWDIFSSVISHMPSSADDMQTVPRPPSGQLVETWQNRTILCAWEINPTYGQCCPSVKRRWDSIGKTLRCARLMRQHPNSITYHQKPNKKVQYCTPDGSASDADMCSPAASWMVRRIARITILTKRLEFRIFCSWNINDVYPCINVHALINENRMF